MKRTQEKIKDIVEPQVFDEVRNVASDPARSVSAYRFTDATSDLLARWLDALADLPRGRGAARALAGARGVGKTHTLTVFGALAGQESLRQLVSDAHVATSARRLSGRRHTVVRVERGTRTTLAEEMAAGCTRAFGGNEVQWGMDPSAMLTLAASRTIDSTLVIVVDTGFDRPARVRRDDGPALAALARATQDTGAFVALALDDDISSADGPNVAIAGAYQIDYLDHEHLYRIADTYILRKNEQARAALHDIYLHLRSTVPGFNWSEPRFSALYPVHPLVADVAAAVRLYAPGFAFLPFAAEAARRATLRPALSLVLLDEVFDRAERDLRKSPELREAFAIFEQLSTQGVARIPVMQRLEAKLILKSLFILSLDGGGATAKGLCAALLVSDEGAQVPAVERVRETLRHFAEAAPPDTLRVTTEAGDGGEPRFCLQISAADKFKTALDRSVEKFAGDDASALAHLFSAARSRFEDWPFPEARIGQSAAVNFSLTWRRSERRGRLVWSGSAAPAESSAEPGGHDLEIQILAPAASVQVSDGETNASAHEGSASVETLAVVWRPAEVAAEEMQALRRLHALRTDPLLVEDFGDAARAALSTLSAQAERAWTRVYLNDGRLITRERGAQPFADTALAARTLALALAETFAPHFNKLYPQHPRFVETLRARDAERLAIAFFSGTARADEEAQRFARSFAVPLGLAEMSGEECVAASFEDGQGPAWVRDVLALVASSDASQPVPIDVVRSALARAPFGLRPEAQNLVLVALIAQRRIEMVNASGERTGRRDLDRAVSWENITGVCPAVLSRLSADELTEWARRLTGRHELHALDGAEPREAARRALSVWLREWSALRLAESFDALPDAAMTARAWKMNEAVQKHFGAAASAIKSALASDAPIEEMLEAVADAFNGDVEKLERLAHDLEALTQMIENFERRQRARAYLLTAEPTGVDEIETARRELLSITRDHESLFDRERNERFKRLWPEFHARYAEHYVAVHDRTVGASSSRRSLDTFLAGDRWREFEMLSQLEVVSRQYWEAAQALLRRAETPRCDLPTRHLLVAHPSCGCAFRLARAEALMRLPRELEALVDLGLEAYRRTLALLGKPLQHALEGIAAREEDHRDLAMRARLLATAFGGGTPPHRFSRIDVHLLERALSEMDSPAPVRVHPPTEDCGLLTREELEARLTQWLDDLPSSAALVELVTGTKTNA